MNLIEAAQMALDALDSDNPDIQLRAAIHLRAALAQPIKPDYSKAGFGQPEQEPIKHWSDCAVHNAPAYPSGKCDCGGFPVAWFDPKGVHLEFDIEDCFSFQEKEGYKPLYTAPPQREWQGLTDEEIEQGMKQAYSTVQGRNLEVAFARAIEAKLKEKNA